jgi:hypothetical protein
MDTEVEKMPIHIIEGTWEEIKCREAELTGRHMRVILTPENHVRRKPSEMHQGATANARTHRVSAMGKYAGRLNSEDFMRQKQEEIEIEDRVRS